MKIWGWEVWSKFHGNELNWEPTSGLDFTWFSLAITPETSTLKQPVVALCRSTNEFLFVFVTFYSNTCQECWQIYGIQGSAGHPEVFHDFWWNSEALPISLAQLAKPNQSHNLKS